MKDELIVVMDMNKGILTFIIENEGKCSIDNIPVDKPLIPCVTLIDKYDGIEIIHD